MRRWAIVLAIAVGAAMAVGTVGTAVNLGKLEKAASQRGETPCGSYRILELGMLATREQIDAINAELRRFMTQHRGTRVVQAWAGPVSVALAATNVDTSPPFVSRPDEATKGSQHYLLVCT